MRDKGLANNLTQYGDRDFSLYLRKAFAKSMGYTDEDLARPIVGIADTGSDLNSCHRHFPEMIAAVKRGVLQAGGLPLAFPTISLGEPFTYPTAMMFRNLLAMDTEEMMRSQPIDSVVLLGGCDKTIPAQLMAAASCDVPAISLAAGPMMTGNYKDEQLGACTDCRRFWAQYRSGSIDEENIRKVESNLCTTAGTCMVMGTASTMACVTEALGMMLPGGAAIPAVHADRLRQAEVSGKVAVELITAGRKPSQILTRQAFENALRVLLAIGGSTNGLVHLAAIAGRLGIELSLDLLDRLSAETPVLVDLKPTGAHYMEDFHKAGGLGVVLHELRHQLHLDCMTVTGRTLREVVEDTPENPDWQSVIAPFDTPIYPKGALAVVRGSLAPDGAIIKRSAANADLLRGERRAVVFESLEDLAARIDDPELDVNADDALVLKNAGPIGGPGMPEAGYLPIPKKLLVQGVTDMVRMSDARMSGTAFGTVVLHIAPEAAVGGPLALVQNGDRILLDVDNNQLDLLVEPDELARRWGNWQPPAVPPTRGYHRLYYEHVQQAPQGCDFDFLRANNNVEIKK
jgi:dihydroxy-acid dehydratase